MTFISVITASYNRAAQLPSLFASLEKQSDRDFEWIVVDDGSVDNTRALCERWADQVDWPLRYIQKPNGGKHTALNRGFALAKGELIITVDSDDTLALDAIATIRENWSSCRTIPDVCGMSFLRLRADGRVIGDRFEPDRELATYIDMRINRGVRGDKAEVWRADILKQFPFPEVEGERFMMESAVWGMIGRRYRMLHVNIGFYVCEYLSDGLTRGGAALTVLCPVGSAHGIRWAIAPPVNMRTRIVMTWRLIAYEFLARRSVYQIAMASGHRLQVLLNLPFGSALYLYWRFKFRRELGR
ncbi:MULTISPECIES: glycosyltransferase family A protein [unclassified Caballeronia]|uniref:glycosyltransferase family 2 protein n=1 Tax=unclassified Caballeronia TaxID=2646786 RepID=UPI00286201CB|nr:MULTISPECIES: glycosyltransferase family A protein [unclassified Caballeronia]MDR5771927.1 glycosyltransferase family A protein [Caballeronia sp. LZ002]MDR5847361.1 glycosyltransferase family A protein [Caballeronia sp. LZ003]